MKKHAKHAAVIVELIAAISGLKMETGLDGWEEWALTGFCVFLLFDLVVRILASKRWQRLMGLVASAARALPPLVAAAARWLDAQPDRLLVGVKKDRLGRLCAVTVIMFGVTQGLRLLPSLLLTASIAAQPAHPQAMLSVVAFAGLMLPLFMCKKVVLAGWRFLADHP